MHAVSIEKRNCCGVLRDDRSTVGSQATSLLARRRHDIRSLRVSVVIRDSSQRPRLQAARASAATATWCNQGKSGCLACGPSRKPTTGVLLAAHHSHPCGQRRGSLLLAGALAAGRAGRRAQLATTWYCRCFVSNLSLARGEACGTGWLHQQESRGGWRPWLAGGAAACSAACCLLEPVGG